MAKASLDEIPSEVAVHAVEGLARDVARVSIRIDLQMDMAALAVRAALSRREQCEVALHHDAYRFLRIIPKVNG
ncbi:hypothetical protein [Microvirga soli]|uniref:hypothetical protein n=1 Tax=Microvirga soli TaxID=1854496 RepID=UPI001920075D|nr:hypothetical protein [Microvirga soli]